MRRRRRSIDAGNRFVTPGFIDVHSHAAEGLSRAELRQARPIVAQGVTTIVVNPDGGGPVDLAAQRATLSKGGVGPNVALLIGHGSVRGAVMQADPNRAPTGDELTQMKALVRAGMEQGAFGLSSGLFYTPGSYSKTEEVVALAAVAGEFGGVYTSHIRDEGDYNVGVVAAVQEVIRIAEEGRLTGIVSHMKALGPDNWGLSMASTQRIAQARARGIPVFADQYPYEASSTSLRAALLPGGVELPKPDATTAAPQPESDQRRRLEDMLRENIRRRGGAASIQIASYAPDRGLEGKRLDEIARDRKKTPEATRARHADARQRVDRFLQHVRRRHPPHHDSAVHDGVERRRPVACRARASRTRATTAPSRAGSRIYVRDEQVIGLEFAIRSMTSLPATVFGMKDRGVIREGAIADIAIFDLDAIRDRATYSDPHQIAEGMTWVFVNGVPIVREGKFTEALPGEVLKK